MSDLIQKVEAVVAKIRTMNFDDLIFYDVKNEWIKISDDKKDIIKCANRQMKETLESFQEIDADSATPFQKICCYKISTLKIDCDVSLFSMLIYAIAYSLSDAKIESQIEGDKYYLRKSGIEYIGDTMNSYATCVRGYLRIFNKNQNIYEANSKVLKNVYSNISENDYWDACVLDNYEYFDKLVPEKIKMYLFMNHTIGNFIPVPKHFNAPRSTKNLDYWDSALYGIYRWFCEFENGDHKSIVGLEDIIGAHNAYPDVNVNIDVCKRWLSNFGTWDNFVEMNYMQDFVNVCEIGDRKFGRPKELWNGHFKNKSKNLNDAESFDEFFNNSSSWITARGCRIATRLKEEFQRKSDREILEQLFL